MNTKHYLIISCVYPPEPVVSSRLSSDLYHSFKESDREVRVLHPRPTRPNGFNFAGSNSIGKDEIVADSYTCPQSSLVGRTKESISFGKYCAHYIKEHHNEIALIYANTWPMGSQYHIVKAAKKYRIPIAMHIQDVYPESLTNKMPSLIGGVLRTILLRYGNYLVTMT